MRTTILLAIAIFAASSLMAVNVIVYPHDVTSGSPANRNVTVTLTGPAGQATSGAWIFTGDSRTLNTGTGGSVTFSNLLAIGQYRLDISGNPPRSFPFSISQTNGTYNVVSLLGTNNSVPVFYDSGEVDALIAMVQAGSITNSQFAQLAIVAITSTNALFADTATNAVNAGGATNLLGVLDQTNFVAGLWINSATNATSARNATNFWGTLNQTNVPAVLSVSSASNSTNFFGLIDQTNTTAAHVGYTNLAVQNWKGLQVHRADGGSVYYSDHADFPGQATKASILLHQVVTNDYPYLAWTNDWQSTAGHLYGFQPDVTFSGTAEWLAMYDTTFGDIQMWGVQAPVLGLTAIGGSLHAGYQLTLDSIFTHSPFTGLIQSEKDGLQFGAYSAYSDAIILTRNLGMGGEWVKFLGVPDGINTGESSSWRVGNRLSVDPNLINDLAFYSAGYLTTSTRTNPGVNVLNLHYETNFNNSAVSVSIPLIAGASSLRTGAPLTIDSSGSGASLAAYIAAQKDGFQLGSWTPYSDGMIMARNSGFGGEWIKFLGVTNGVSGAEQLSWRLGNTTNMSDPLLANDLTLYNAAGGMTTSSTNPGVQVLNFHYGTNIASSDMEVAVPLIENYDATFNGNSNVTNSDLVTLSRVNGGSQHWLRVFHEGNGNEDWRLGVSTNATYDLQVVSGNGSPNTASLPGLPFVTYHRGSPNQFVLGAGVVGVGDGSGFTNINFGSVSNGLTVVSNYIAAISQNATNEALRQATSLTNGAVNNLSNLVATISLNATNNDIKMATGITNGAINNLSNLVATISLNATNQALLIGLGATNEALRQATSLTNGAVNNLSNLVATISVNDTNQSLKIGLNATNNDALVSGNISNYVAAVAAAAPTLAGQNNFSASNYFAAGIGAAGVSRMGILVVTNGLTNSALTANSAVYADANGRLTSIPAGGANQFLKMGVTPPAAATILGSDISGAVPTASIATVANGLSSGSPGTNNVIWGDANQTNGVFMTRLGLVESNNLGFVSLTGGNITNSGNIVIGTGGSIASANGLLSVGGTATISGNNPQVNLANGTFTANAGLQQGANITSTVLQSGTASFDALAVTPTATTAGSGPQNLLKMGSPVTTVMNVDFNGNQTNFGVIKASSFYGALHGNADTASAVTSAQYASTATNLVSGAFATNLSMYAADSGSILMSAPPSHTLFFMNTNGQFQFNDAVGNVLISYSGAPAASDSISVGKSAGPALSSDTTGTFVWDNKNHKRITATDSAVTVATNATVSGTLGYWLPVAAKTANYSVVIGDSGTYFNNAGAVGAVTNSLPASTPGQHYGLAVVTGQNIAFKASGAETIRSVGGVSGAGGLVFSSTVGATLHLYCPAAGGWFIDSTNGAFTIQ